LSQQKNSLVCYELCGFCGVGGLDMRFCPENGEILFGSRFLDVQSGCYMSGFQPLGRWPSDTWGFAPGWYMSGLRP
jgi:hypothetical protein